MTPLNNNTTKSESETKILGMALGTSIRNEINCTIEDLKTIPNEYKANNKKEILKNIINMAQDNSWNVILPHYILNNKLLRNKFQRLLSCDIILYKYINISDNKIMLLFNPVKISEYMGEYRFSNDKINFNLDIRARKVNRPMVHKNRTMTQTMKSGNIDSIQGSNKAMSNKQISNIKSNIIKSEVVALNKLKAKLCTSFKEGSALIAFLLKYINRDIHIIYNTESVFYTVYNKELIIYVRPLLVTYKKAIYVPQNSSKEHLEVQKLIKVVNSGVSYFPRLGIYFSTKESIEIFLKYITEKEGIVNRLKEYDMISKETRGITPDYTSINVITAILLFVLGIMSSLIYLTNPFIPLVNLLLINLLGLFGIIIFYFELRRRALMEFEKERYLPMIKVIEPENFIFKTFSDDFIRILSSFSDDLYRLEFIMDHFIFWNSLSHQGNEYSHEDKKMMNSTLQKGGMWWPKYKYMYNNVNLRKGLIKNKTTGFSFININKNLMNWQIVPEKILKNILKGTNFNLDPINNAEMCNFFMENYIDQRFLESRYKNTVYKGMYRDILKNIISLKRLEEISNETIIKTFKTSIDQKDALWALEILFINLLKSIVQLVSKTSYSKYIKEKKYTGINQLISMILESSTKNIDGGLLYSVIEAEQFIIDGQIPSTQRLKEFTQIFERVENEFNNLNNNQQNHMKINNSTTIKQTIKQTSGINDNTPVHGRRNRANIKGAVATEVFESKTDDEFLDYTNNDVLGEDLEEYLDDLSLIDDMDMEMDMEPVPSKGSIIEDDEGLYSTDPLSNSHIHNTHMSSNLGLTRSRASFNPIGTTSPINNRPGVMAKHGPSVLLDRHKSFFNRFIDGGLYDGTEDEDDFDEF
ncbi:MAG: hypothetical protein ACTSU2_03090 [Promethearchaeota archaeon]